MTLFAIQQHSWTALELIRQTLMRSVQSIECSLHLIYKNLFSIKQYQFPPQNWPEFIQRVTPYFATECSSTAGAIHLPYTARSHGGVRQGVEGVSLSVRPTRTKLDYDHGNTTYQMFSSATAGVMNSVSVFFFFLARAREKWIPISRWSLGMTGCQPT